MASNSRDRSIMKSVREKKEIVKQSRTSKNLAISLVVTQDVYFNSFSPSFGTSAHNLLSCVFSHGIEPVLSQMCPLAGWLRSPLRALKALKAV